MCYDTSSDLTPFNFMKVAVGNPGSHSASSLQSRKQAFILQSNFLCSGFIFNKHIDYIPL